MNLFTQANSLLAARTLHLEAAPGMRSLSPIDTTRPMSIMEKRVRYSRATRSVVTTWRRSCFIAINYRDALEQYQIALI